MDKIIILLSLWLIIQLSSTKPTVVATEATEVAWKSARVVYRRPARPALAN